MNKTIMIIIAVAGAFLLQSCAHTLTDEAIKSYVWKCGTPCGLGDVLVFEKTNYTTIRNDTIFVQDAPYGKIIQRSNDWDEDTKISVLNLADTSYKDTCIFHAK